MATRKKKAASASRIAGLPADWQLPAFADRRRAPRPDHETPQQKKRGAARRKKA